jgi:MOSC domain-containing protein YiiM/ferredoxin-NADP reductase
MNGKVISLNVGEPRVVTYRGTSFRTGIFKQPTDKPLALKKLNFAGDGQADVSAHGGIDKAVYCYPIEHYDFWRHELARAALPMGQFGENVTTQGVLESELRIGDVLAIGTAVVQVSEPRIPCYKLVMRMEAGGDFAIRFVAANRTGFYCRVLQEGIVKGSDELTLLHSDASSPTVSEVVAATQFAGRDPAALRRVRKARGISVKWQSRVRRMIDAEVRRRIETSGAQRNSFIVNEVVPETKDALSIWLRPADGARLVPALPGQYVTIVWADGMMRTYSLSAFDADRRYRITVKLVSDAQGVLGQASARIADLKAGDVLTVERPRGNFHPDVDDDTPVVLAAAGIGVTPIMAMLEHATRQGRRNVFAAFGMRRADEHPLVSELKALVAERRHLSLMLAYSRHDGAPIQGLPAPKQGRLTAADLLPYATTPLAEVFLCGPGEFIRQMHDGLVERGVNSQCIRYESFGPSTLRPVPAVTTDPDTTFTISFTRSDVQAVWSPSSGTLLNLAEAAGVSPAFGCRSGACGLCRTEISKGRVSYVEPIDEPDDGYVFPCCAIPETDCRLDL